MIRKIKALYGLLFSYHTSGTGMYSDYSYIKHNMIPYTGLYGVQALLGRVFTVDAITAQTPFKLRNEEKTVYEDWIINGFAPLMVNGGMMNMTRGRAVEDSTQTSDGIRLVASMLDMLENVSDEARLSFKQIIKREMSGYALNEAYKNLSPRQVATLDKILEDPTVQVCEHIGAQVFYNMDRVVQHRKNYAAGLAMSSERIANYESIDNVNKRGWYQSDGMLYIYRRSDNLKTEQYGTLYFKNADPYKLPGTTVDIQPREEVSIPTSGEYFSARSFVGGATLEGEFSTAAMDLEAFHNDKADSAQPLFDCDLTAAKAWFMFDDEIVALGAGINATKGEDIITTVENCIISDNAQITADGQTAESGLYQNVNYVFASERGGYYFPNGSDVYINRTKNNASFFEMWVNHKKNPQGEKYAYVLLPEMTESQTESYAKKPHITVISNDEKIQAVKENTLNLTGYVFRAPGAFDGVKVSEALIVMKREYEDRTVISFADPTHKLNSVDIETEGSYAAAVVGNGNIKTEKTAGAIRVRADLSKSRGESFEVTLLK